MNKKEEVHKEITKIWLILANAKDCFHYSFYLHKPKTIKEQIYIDASVDFIFIRGILWKMTVTELSKLFSSKKNDRYSILRFVEKFKNDGCFSNQGIDNKIIDEWKNEIKNNNNTIQEIITLRDKAYSHTDLNYNEYNSEITFEQTEKLINIVEKIITNIYEKVLHSDVHINTDRFEKKSIEIIKILAEHKKINEEFDK